MRKRRMFEGPELARGDLWMVRAARDLFGPGCCFGSPPPVTPAGNPTGTKMDDGFSTVIAFNLNPNINFWEKAVKPPGVDGGNAIDTTTMRNVTWRTMDARKLKTLTSMTAKGNYDPNIYTSGQIFAILNKPGGITVIFPNGDTLSFYGFLEKFEPGEQIEGTFPEGEFTITPTNQDPSDKTEQAPVMVEKTGT